MTDVAGVQAAEGAKRISVNVQDLRKPYGNEKEPYLLERNMNKDPFLQFDTWFRDVSSRQLSYEEVNAVVLSTALNNKPSSRMVLLKGYGSDGFSFYTNSVSRKAAEFLANPNASMLFYWPVVNRQVRVEGVIEALAPELADAYWKSRPLKSRIGSKLSSQSSFLEDKRAELERIAAERGEAAITRPKTWLGYILKPTYFEFWQGQSDRIHDRITYTKNEGNADEWSMQRLAP